MSRFFFALIISLPAFCQMTGSMRQAIDQAALKVLKETGGPGASIAIVMDGKIAYESGYGYTRVETKTPVQNGMQFKIASNSKQIAATAILLLAEEGKVSLDDTVSRFVPGLTRGGEITIRELLSHTSGYQDYYPLDYVAPFMMKPASPQSIVDTWAKKPLDFEPGTRWEYSNTNYTVVGMIIEKITGKPMMEFLRTRIFEPLGMRSAIDEESQPWSAADPIGYTHFALGPVRPVTPEARGWMYAAGELAMSAHDLALWDISLMQGKILKPASMAALTTDTRLKNGTATGYALGLQVSDNGGHLRWSHTGGAAGFLSINSTWPRDRVSITVLTNGESRAYREIGSQVEKIVLAKTEDPQAAASLDLVRRLFLDLQNGKVDRSALTADLNAYFSTQAVADFSASLKPLGAPAEFRQTSSQARGGMTERSFRIKAGGKALSLSTYFTPAGKLAQYLIDVVAE